MNDEFTCKQVDYSKRIVNLYLGTRDQESTPGQTDEPGSSVSAVSDYELDGRGSIPDRGRGFFL
jgi:hypothetical protein